MNRKRRKNRDEVTLEIKDSEGSEKRYWNLRGNEEYSYNQGNSESIKDEINVEFNLNENRNLTEKQKQEILNTLLSQPAKKEQKETRNPSNKWIILLILIALSGPIIALIALNTGC